MLLSSYSLDYRIVVKGAADEAQVGQVQDYDYLAPSLQS